MQFEWALKHIHPRNAGGIKNRIKKLNILLNKKKWTSKAPDADLMPLTLEWIDKEKDLMNMLCLFIFKKFLKTTIQIN